MKTRSSTRRFVGVVSTAWLMPWAAEAAPGPLPIDGEAPIEEPAPAVEVVGERAACLGVGNQSCTQAGDCDTNACAPVGNGMAYCIIEQDSCTTKAECYSFDCYVFEGLACPNGDECGDGFSCQYGNCVHALTAEETFVMAVPEPVADAGTSVDDGATDGGTSDGTDSADGEPTTTGDEESSDGLGSTSSNDTRSDAGTSAEGDGTSDRSSNEKSASDGCSVAGSGQNTSTGALLLLALSWLGSAARRRRAPRLD